MNKKIPLDMRAGTIHSTKFGDLEIIEYLDSRNVNVRFNSTGYERRTTSGNIRKGLVKDLFKPSVFGVGFLGGVKHTSHVNGKMTSAYSHWSGMLERCYSTGSKERYPTYIGCTVDPIWHNFQAFAEWYNPIKDRNPELNYLDKDIIIDGNKVYGPNTCILTTNQKNTEKAHAKNWRFISPDGILFEIYNLRKFCRDNNLHNPAMQYVHRGANSHHKGWTKA